MGMMSVVRVLDIGCGQGGASMGYHLAGCEVEGVDIEPQPRYPFKFHMRDGFDVLRDRAFVADFHFIHMSWPCQHYLSGTLCTVKPTADLVTPGRMAANATGLPWVMENVMRSPLNRSRSIELCANAFGLRTYRHRLFEPSAGLTLSAPPHLPHIKRVANRRRRELWDQGWHASITGDVGTYVGPQAMGINWMTGNGLSEAIPPCYTRWVAGQILTQIRK